MTDDTTGRTRPLGETTGSSQRPPQRLTGTVLAFDLRAEQEQLKQEEAWIQGDHNAKTLVKESDFRIVLIALKKGCRIDQHHQAGRLSIQTVSGKLKIFLEDEEMELPARHLLALERDVRHGIEALEESLLLLTLAWSNGDGSAA